MVSAENMWSILEMHFLQIKLQYCIMVNYPALKYIITPVVIKKDFCIIGKKNYTYLME